MKKVQKRLLGVAFLLAMMMVVACSAFAANTSYSKFVATEFSGQADFGYFYTYKGEDRSVYPYQEANYKCFSVVSADGQRFYAAVKDTQYEYARSALENQSITLSGKYQQTAGDGTPIFVASNVITTNDAGEKVSTLFGNVVWAAIDHGDIVSEIFKTFRDVYSDYTITIADDASYLMIDTNPFDYKSDTSLADTGLDHVETLNKTLGLPDWLYKEMLNTRALDGRQKESFDQVTVTWSYHPDQGLEVIYRTNS